MSAGYHPVRQNAWIIEYLGGFMPIQVSRSGVLGSPLTSLQ